MKKVLITKDGRGKFVNETFRECIKILTKAEEEGSYAFFNYTASAIQGNKPFLEDFENCFMWAITPGDDVQIQEENIETKDEFEKRRKEELKKMKEMQKEAEAE